jgi:hypothetical protein
LQFALSGPDPEDAYLIGCIYLAGLTFTRFFDAFDLNKVESYLPLTARIRRFIPLLNGTARHS